MNNDSKHLLWHEAALTTVNRQLYRALRIPGEDGIRLAQHAIRIGADVNMETPWVRTALERDEYPDTSTILVDAIRGHYITAKRGGAQAKMKWVEPRPDIAALLIQERDIDLDKPQKRPKHAETPLVSACEMGNMELVRLLLDHGANPDLSAAGATPLHHTIAPKHPPDSFDALTRAEIIKKLISSGAKSKAENAHGKKPLQIAIERNGAPNDMRPIIDVLEKNLHIERRPSLQPLERETVENPDRHKDLQRQGDHQARAALNARMKRRDFKEMRQKKRGSYREPTSSENGHDGGFHR